MNAFLFWETRIYMYDVGAMLKARLALLYDVLGEARGCCFTSSSINEDAFS
jgi:hypothetical protein